MDDLELVRIVRGVRRADRLDGFVLAVGESWLLMTEVDEGVSLNGFTALRPADVVKVKRRKNPFVRRALELHGEWPPARPLGEVSLATTRELIESAAACYPLVTLYLEEMNPGMCFIGVPAAFTRASAYLQEVTPRATWEDTTRKYKLSDITQVAFGARYEGALHDVAGPPPLRQDLD